MTYDQYWNQDTSLAYYYQMAHRMHMNQRNQELWLQGAYVFNAFSTALSNLHFDGKKHKMNEYVEKPFRIFPLTEEEKAEQLEIESKRMEANLNNFMLMWKAKEVKENGK